MKIGIITWSYRFAFGYGRHDQTDIPGYLTFPKFIERVACFMAQPRQHTRPPAIRAEQP